MTPILGIDPGLSGGIALLEKGKSPLVAKLPETERDVFDFFRELCSGMGAQPVAYVEGVQAMPQHVQGRTQGVRSSFKFGMGYGGLRMALIAIAIPFITVPPSTWQRAMNCLSKGDKNVTKRRAQEIFPTVKVTHAVADALLIASYGWHRHYAKHYPED